MKFDKIKEIYENKPIIPSIIEETILSLFGVKRIQELKNKELLFNKIDSLFNRNSKTNYSKSHKEYTLYYFPVNFYKIWQPLMDLSKYNQIKNNVDILELGVGPGSCTFGLMEFYRNLAIDNPSLNFKISFCLIEKETEFIKIFNYIFEKYKSIFPINFCVDIVWLNVDLNNKIDLGLDKFNLIIESNMLNNNEKVSEKVVDNLIAFSANNLKEHSSLILIEPAKEKNGSYLKDLKQRFQKVSFMPYSPCYCNSETCEQFMSAKSYINNFQIIKGLKEYKKSKDYHYYEYVVLRNDGLKKFGLINNKLFLRELGDNVGDNITLKAFILSSSNQASKIALKICDGSLCTRTDIWLDIPKNLLKTYQFNSLDINRGEFIEIKNAKIISKNHIVCDLHTQIKILR